MGYEEESDGELDEESSENDDFVEMRLSWVFLSSY
jgi:hypothetical protein